MLKPYLDRRHVRPVLAAVAVQLLGVARVLLCEEILPAPLHLVQVVHQLWLCRDDGRNARLLGRLLSRAV